MVPEGSLSGSFEAGTRPSTPYSSSSAKIPKVNEGQWVDKVWGK